MKQAAKQIAIWMALLVVFCVVCRLTVCRSYTAYVLLHQPIAHTLTPDNVRVENRNPEVVRILDVRTSANWIRFSVHPIRAGVADVLIYGPSDLAIGYRVFRVGVLGTVFDLASSGFTGDTAVLIAATLFWFVLGAIMLWHYFQSKGPAFYAQSSVFFSGFSLFSLVTGGVMLHITARHLIFPAMYGMYSAFSALNSASAHFMQLTMPLILLFAAALAISNLALLRHEKPVLQNVLSLMVSVLMIAGEIVGLYLFSRDFMGSEWEGRIRNTLENSYATFFVYFECILAGSVICGLKAARYRPAPDKDAIIILGCWFRKDGTLPPLLRGRVDLAVDFFRNQTEISGKKAVFIPSGGQGKDEPMPEAEAMRKYLMAQGIPPADIYPENQSTNTYQNMAYSKKLVDQIAPNGNVLFVTTNYHVFRSGICASQAGLRAEGIGGKTAWWYWPNAFLRECAGLMQKHWKEETVLLILMIVFFGLLSMIL